MYCAPTGRRKIRCPGKYAQKFFNNYIFPSDEAFAKLSVTQPECLMIPIADIRTFTFGNLKRKQAGSRQRAAAAGTRWMQVCAGWLVSGNEEQVSR